MFQAYLIDDGALESPCTKTPHFPSEFSRGKGGGHRTKLITHGDAICKTRDVLLLPFISAQVGPRLSVIVDIRDDYEI